MMIKISFLLSVTSLIFVSPAFGMGMMPRGQVKLEPTSTRTHQNAPKITSKPALSTRSDADADVKLESETQLKTSAVPELDNKAHDDVDAAELNPDVEKIEAQQPTQ